MVHRLLDWMASNPRPLVAAECEVSVALGDTVVSGRVDRLDRDADGSVVVVDFKTGASAATKKAAAENPQLGVYQWAVEQGGAAPAGTVVVAGGGELVYLAASTNEKAKVLPQPPLGAAPDPAWASGLVDAVAQGARQPVFAALVTSACGGCPVRASCPALPDGGRVTA
jgi:RecB family exonuclease